MVTLNGVVKNPPKDKTWGQLCKEDIHSKVSQSKGSIKKTKTQVYKLVTNAILND